MYLHLLNDNVATNTHKENNTYTCVIFKAIGLLVNIEPYGGSLYTRIWFLI